ncbi:MAG: InlB B-repeat-containing protein [Corallococcus sp.]|nr:InlB B-repeat-containing protein [Corallococcus sp.]
MISYNHDAVTANTPSLVVLSNDNRVYYGGDFSIKTAYKYQDGRIDSPYPDTIKYESDEPVVSVDTDGKVEVVEDIYNGSIEYNELSVVISISSSNKNVKPLQVNITVVPVNTYSITQYYYDANTLELKSKLVPVWQGQTVDEIVDPSLSNYFFENWYVVSIGDKTLSTPMVFHAEDKYLWGDNISIKPKFYADLQFNADDMPITEKISSPVKVYFDMPLENSLPTLENDLSEWSFDGWYTERGGVGDKNGVRDGVFRAVEPVLYAKWSGTAQLVLTDIISNDDNKDIITRNGTVGILSANAATEVSVVYNGAVQLNSSQIPTYTYGGAFGGWYTELYGTGEQITDERGVGIYNAKSLRLYDKIVFAVNVDYNAATGNYDESIDAFTVAYGDTVDFVGNGLVRNPSKTGWTFSGWEVVYGPDKFQILDDAQFTLLDDITISAVWKWTFNLNTSIEGYSLTDKTCTITYQDDFSSLPSLEDWGSWSFDGWYSQTAGDGYRITSSNYDAIASNNLSKVSNLYAKWIIKTLTLNDKTGEDSYIYNLIYGKTLKEQGGLPTPASRAGYTKDETSGWYTDDRVYSVRVGDGSTSYPASMTILYYKWIPETYKITLNPNGGTSAVTEIEVTMGEALPRIAAPKYVGKTFSGYFTQRSGGILYYQPSGNDAISNGIWEVPDANGTVLYAQWDTQLYTVYFDGNGGKCALESISVIFDEIMTSPNGNIPIRTGYTFDGFYDNKEGTGDPYYKEDDNHLINVKKWNKSSNGTLYAKWNKNPYTIVYDANGGKKAPSNQEATYDEDIVLSTSKPSKDSNKFLGWSTTKRAQLSNGSSLPDGDYKSGDTVKNLATYGTVTLYAVWADDSCVAAGTLITLADGSRVPVEQLKGDELLLVWNIYTGEFDVAPILFVDSDSEAVYEIINLYFSDGTSVKAISEHGFWDYNLNEWVFLRNDADKYIGHWFSKQTDIDGELTSERVQLTGVVITEETTTAWSPVTFGHLCYYVNGMLSMPGATEGFINIFDVDPATMKVDEAKMAADVEKYGLFTYEDFAEYIPEEVFCAFNGQYLKVAMGKGLLTWDDIFALIERYQGFWQINEI